MISFHETLLNMRADIFRRALLEGKGQGLFALISVLTKRGMVSVILYRIARFAIHHRLGFLSKLIFYFNYLYCRNEISPQANLGPGLVLGDCGGIGLSQVTVTGENCTFLGFNTTTLGAMEGFDLSKDQIIFGSHCVLGIRSRVIRPISLANGTQVFHNSVVIKSSTREGAMLWGVPAKLKKTESYKEIVNWNPINKDFISGV